MFLMLVFYLVDSRSPSLKMPTLPAYDPITRTAHWSWQKVIQPKHLFSVVYQLLVVICMAYSLFVVNFSTCVMPTISKSWQIKKSATSNKSLVWSMARNIPVWMNFAMANWWLWLIRYDDASCFIWGNWHFYHRITMVLTSRVSLSISLMKCSHPFLTFLVSFWNLSHPLSR